ncbi:MAG: sodium:solute symporter [Candidatus Latescibacteria bacterium]|nr:sodium:solute symporter [Candidatus Latescibacterota bacterium]
MILKRMASQSLDDYFLGGRKLPWWALGVSGMASYLDITGTMIIVSFLFMLGPRGLFIEFRGGAVLPLAFMMIFSGKWHRRSRCMTGAEWMIFRFGEGIGGQFARIAQSTAVILLTIGMLAYLVKGVGLFLSMFLPFSPLICSIIMICVASIYTMASGFYGVVFTDMFQSIIILVAVITISVLAFLKAPDMSAIAALAGEVTGSAEWTTSRLQWLTSMPKGYEAYSHLTMFAMFYLLRQIIGGVGAGDDPKYYGAKSDRECGKLTFFWTNLMMFRWPMMMAFAVLGLYLVRDLFPDQSVLMQSAELIKTYMGNIDKSRWADALAAVMNNPGQYPDLVSGLKGILGSDWASKLHLLSFEGTINPERILPAVILFNIPMGFRGMILVALIAASMSTFDSTVNRTAGFFVKDLYQRYMRPKASNKELIYASWVFIVALVTVGFALGYTTESINDIWGWINMSLGVGLLLPGFLRFLWWRFNGGGFAIGTLSGMIFAILQRIIVPDLDERSQFLICSTISVLGCIIGTYLTKPTDRAVLENFYRKTRPFGLWKPLKNILEPDVRAVMEKEHRNDLTALPFVMLWQVSLFMLPMLFIIKSYGPFLRTFGIFAVSLAVMYVFWYKKLPSD